MVRLMTGWVFQRGYASGSFGAKARAEGAAAAADLKRAGKLGRKIATDINRAKKYPWQNLPARVVKGALMKPAFQRAILTNRDGMMKGVYTNLETRGLI